MVRTYVPSHFLDPVASCVPSFSTLDMDIDLERARMLGKLIADWRRDKGLSRPETLTELSKQGVDLSYSHLQKMEKGERSLASASVEIREGLRHLYGVSREVWEAKTGLYVPASHVGPDRRLSNITPGDRLKKLREDKGLTPEQAADQTHGAVTPRRLANLEDRPGAWHKVTEDEVKNLARAYGMIVINFLDSVNGTPYPAKPNIFTDEVVLETHDINQGRRRIPVIDLLSAGPGGDGGTVVSHIDLGPEYVGPHSAFRVSGDSMVPDIVDQGTVIVRNQNYASPKNTIVCWTPEDGMLCKFLDRVEDGYYVLTSTNPMYKPIWTREIHIYGIVVEARKPFPVINGNH